MNTTNTLIRLVYVSTATDLLSENELQQILEISRRNNRKKDVTGLLLYSSGNILQILEGEEAVLSNLYAKISQDHRHFGIIKLQQAKIESRTFQDWSMGYKTLTAGDFDKAKGYFDIRNNPLIDLQNADNAIKDILEMFLEHNK